MEEKSLDKELERPQEGQTQASQEMTKQEVKDTLDNVLSVEQKEEYLNKYVGEGKKYKSIEDLAKSYAHAEQFIATLKKEKEEMEAEMHQLREAAKLVKEFEEEQKSEEIYDIDSKVKEAIEKEKIREKEMQNRHTLKGILLNHFKDDSKAVEAINNFTNGDPSKKELFNKLCGIDPMAAAKLLGVPVEQPKQQRTLNTTLGEGNATSNSVTSAVLPITWSEARRVRTNDPVKYKSHQFQQLLHKSAIEAEKQGIDFFKT